MKHLIRRLILLNCSNSGWLVQYIICYLTLIILSRLSLPVEGVPSYIYHSYIILCAVFSGTINSFQDLENDFKTGHIHQFMLSNLSGASVTATYILFKLLVNNLVLIIVQPLIMIVLDMPNQEVISVSVSTILAVSYNTIITFVASCLNSSRQNNVIIMLLTFPLTIPGIILSIMGIRFPEYHFLLTGIILTILPLSIFVCEKVIMVCISEV